MRSRGVIGAGVVIVMAATIACGDDRPRMLRDAATDASTDSTITGADSSTDVSLDAAGDGGDAEPSASCGDGRLDAGELCDPAIDPGLEGSCPEACAAVECSVSRVVNDGPCRVHCAYEEIGAGPVDGCCPAGADHEADADCPEACGNGRVDSGETCDVASAGSCPTACDDGDPCSEDILLGAGTCTARCTDGPTDLCALACGDGALQAFETCDVAIAAGAVGACPTRCDDAMSCTTDELLDAGTCDAHCRFTPITRRVDGDGCCPSGADPTTDDDCPTTCGNGTREAWETCDTRASGADACPTLADCDDADACTTDLVRDDGTCDATCDNTAVTMPVSGDGCCPPGADTRTDSDCVAAPMCESTDIRIASDFSDISSLTTAVDDDGALWALWIEHDTTDEVRASRLDPATGAWRADEQLTSDFSDISSLTTAVDDDGALWALWLEHDTTDEVRASRLDPATGAWRADESLTSDFSDFTSLTTAVDDDGALWALWLEHDTTDEVRASRLDPATGAWRADESLTSDFSDFTSLTTAVDDDGALWALWLEHDTTDEVRASRLDPATGAWRADESLTSDFSDFTWLTTAVDDDGALWALWLEHDTTDEVRASRLDPATGAWRADESLTSDFSDFTSLTTAVDDDGALWALWLEHDTTDEVRASRLDPATGAWRADEQLTSDFSDFTSLTTTTAADGSLWAFWIEMDTTDEIRASRLDELSGDWSMDIRGAVDFSDMAALVATNDDDANLLALWIEMDTTDEVRATTCGEW